MEKVTRFQILSICTGHCFLILYFCIQTYQVVSHTITNNKLIPALIGCKILLKFEDLGKANIAVGNYEFTLTLSNS